MVPVPVPALSQQPSPQDFPTSRGLILLAQPADRGVLCNTGEAAARSGRFLRCGFKLRDTDGGGPWLLSQRWAMRCRPPLPRPFVGGPIFKA